MNRRPPDLARRILEIGAAEGSAADTLAARPAASPDAAASAPAAAPVSHLDGRMDGRLDWPRLAQAALDRDLLDAVDITLMRTLARRAGCAGDAAFQAVVGCLLAAVKGGALRIPADRAALAARLEVFLRSLHYSPDPESAEVRTLGFAAALAASDPSLLAPAIAAAFHAAWESGAYRAVLGAAGDGAFTPLLRSGAGLYFQKHQAAEARAGLGLARLLSAADLDVEPDTARAILATVLDRFPLRIGAGPEAPPMQFREGQRLALALALRKRLAVISGGPGTGKTSLVANLLRAKARLPRPGEAQGGGSPPPLRIRLAAPTGRAAQRVTESLRGSLAGIAYQGEGAVEAALDRRLAGLAGETLHRLLRYHPESGEFFHRKDRPIPADLVIVDEVSMVDIFALARLVDALEEDASLVLIGDMDQLPSVEAGAVLADLVPGPEAYAFSAEEAARLAEILPGEILPLPQGRGPAPLRDHLVVLDRSHRSEAGILEVARRINALDGAGALAAMGPPAGPKEAEAHPAEGPWPLSFLEEGRRVTPGGGCSMLSTGGAGAAAGLSAWLDSWAGFHYLGHPQNPADHPGKILAAPRRMAYAALLDRLAAAGPDDVGSPPWHGLIDEAFAYLDQARILTFTRKGWHGSVAVNRHFRERLAPLWDVQAPPSRDRADAFHGAPILIQENEYAKDLFNGEVGLMLRVRGRCQAWFRKEGGFRPYPAQFLPRHELAFASTVHKAQGSEYDQVMIVLPEAGNRLLFKETLYTALTRARLFAGLYGPTEVFLEAVGRKVERESGLRDFLGGAPAAWKLRQDP